jgi:hypothetical protein
MTALNMPASTPELDPGDSEHITVLAVPAKPKRKWFGLGKKDPAARKLSKAERPVKPPRKRPSRKDKKLTPAEGKLCLQCGKPNALDANFCQYCAAPFDTAAESQ